ncbi:MAG TPA: ATP-dependent Clp protease adaptor ClpS [Solirubrobacterales bacterium]|nr:ATP-dependent Clp protease adaptor ClpS [Solirubrobacterales bacterium]
MGSQTIERPHTRGPGSGWGGLWHVIVLNDDHNTFEGVAHALSRILPSTSLSSGFELADEIHVQGRATVWSGQQETAELYWEQLCDFGLTMAPLAQG